MGYTPTQARVKPIEIPTDRVTRSPKALLGRSTAEGYMRSNTVSGRTKRSILPEDPDGLAARLRELLVGQPEAIDIIVPYVQMYQAGLAPDGRPVGVVLLLGPTGTGKTRTVEALAEVLHGSSKNLLKIDCGEFQMEHEVAKLIGAPPGYLGHRETQPMLTQAKVNAVASEESEISLILFDEIEKAAPSMTRLLLGILDKATLRLGDNSSVNFEPGVAHGTGVCTTPWVGHSTRGTRAWSRVWSWHVSRCCHSRSR